MTFLLWLMLAVPQQAMPAMGKSSITRTGPPPTAPLTSPLVFGSQPLVLVNGQPLILQ